MTKTKRPTKKARQRAAARAQEVVTYVTSRGVELELLPIATMLDELRQTFPPQPKTPVRVVHGIGDATKEISYTAESIKDAPEEDKALWAQYLTEQAAWSDDTGTKMLRVIALRGVRFKNEPDEKKWVPEHTFMGFTVPEPGPERTWYYFKTEVVGSQYDGQEIMLGVYKASGMNKEVLEKVEERFQLEMGRSGGTDAGPDQEDTAEEGPAEQEGVVVEPVVDAD